MKPIKPMLPTLVPAIPEGDKWLFEVKYDGYRALLHIGKEDILFQSRNLKSLSHSFPEVMEEARKIRKIAADSLPVIFDGEVCILQSKWKASFSDIQKRGRLKNTTKIGLIQSEHPATFLIFDMLMVKGETLFNQPYEERKRNMIDWMVKNEVQEVGDDVDQPIHWVNFHENGNELFACVKDNHGEGVIAKDSKSRWVEGKRTNDWLKIKNLSHGNFIVSGYDFENGFVHVVVIRDGSFYNIGLFSHGLEGSERGALIETVKANQEQKTGNLVHVRPGICVELEFLELYEEQLRQPRFVRFRLDLHWEECTWEALQNEMVN